MIHATTQMTMKWITLSEISQTQKSIYCMIQFVWRDCEGER